MRIFQFKLCRLVPKNAIVNRIGTIITHGLRQMIQHRYNFIQKEKPLASVMETESHVRIFTNIICEMRSMHVYSEFDAVMTPKVTNTWLAVTSSARYAVDARKLAVTK